MVLIWSENGLDMVLIWSGYGPDTVLILINFAIFGHVGLFFMLCICLVLIWLVLTWSLFDSDMYGPDFTFLTDRLGGKEA